MIPGLMAPEARVMRDVTFAISTGIINRLGYVKRVNLNPILTLKTPIAEGQILTPIAGYGRRRNEY